MRGRGLMLTVAVLASLAVIVAVPGAWVWPTLALLPLGWLVAWRPDSLAPLGWMTWAIGCWTLGGGQSLWAAAVVALALGHAVSISPQIALVPEICHDEIAKLGQTTVLGLLRTFERAGSVVGDLDKRAGDFAPPKRSVTATKEKAAEEKADTSSPAQLYIDLARELGKLDDPVIRQKLAQAHILGTITRLTTERHKAVRSQGGDIPGVANFSKLLMADIIRLNRDLGMELLGPRGMLHDYDDDNRGAMAELPGGARAVAVTAQALGAQALPIYGGTDQIQRNIVGERALGLPKEPGDVSKLPFNELPKNG